MFYQSSSGVQIDLLIKLKFTVSSLMQLPVKGNSINTVWAPALKP
jgi:hypothetical protein